MGQNQSNMQVTQALQNGTGLRSDHNWTKDIYSKLQKLRKKEKEY